MKSSIEAGRCNDIIISRRRFVAEMTIAGIGGMGLLYSGLYVKTHPLSPNKLVPDTTSPEQKPYPATPAPERQKTKEVPTPHTRTA